MMTLVVHFYIGLAVSLDLRCSHSFCFKKLHLVISIYQFSILKHELINTVVVIESNVPGWSHSINR